MIVVFRYETPRSLMQEISLFGANMEGCLFFLENRNFYKIHFQNKMPVIDFEFNPNFVNLSPSIDLSESIFKNAYWMAIPMYKNEETLKNFLMDFAILCFYYVMDNLHNKNRIQFIKLDKVIIFHMFTDGMVYQNYKIPVQYENSKYIFLDTEWEKEIVLKNYANPIFLSYILSKITKFIGGLE